ncbi:MAG: cell division protein SepF [Clostridia bacterium]|jgi:cell division inhibitor SepF|nr:cell division protein SepF [Clostridia bacterium]MBO7549196.1 cell division protein SepF [Clostridia bacterium]MBO7666268.1 cell division protein SepF [Clostridia bacterium]MBP5238088.1 cell division protein SepF [Clostridia bacterium]MBP5657611.1 cell division protein SepF [Clostridia bacterium]
MGIFDFVRNTFNGENTEDDYEKKYDDEMEEEAVSAAVGAVRESSSVVSPVNLEMKVCKPSRYDEVAGISTHLLQHKTVVLNLENANREVAIRIIDFLSGVTFAIKGQIKNVASSTYVITPDHVEVTGDQKAAEPAAAPEQPAVKQPREFF